MIDNESDEYLCGLRDCAALISAALDESETSGPIVDFLQDIMSQLDSCREARLKAKLGIECRKPRRVFSLERST
jgi:hypothetical protein